MATTQAKRACSVCGTVVPDDSPYCPVCALRVAGETESNCVTHTDFEPRFDHYQVLGDKDGKPLELGQGGMGVTYKAIHACEMLPVSKDAVDGPGLLTNLAVVYAWANELDLAFTTLGPMTRMPLGIYYGQLKRDPYWEPLRKDPRYEKLLAQLAATD